jgi:probable HAF family extracellular repeat protein
MESLGTLTGGTYSIAWSVNADGSVVVGFSDSVDGSSAFIWRGQMVDFENLITSFPVLGNDSAVALVEQHGALSDVMGQSSLAAAGQTVVSTRAGAQHTGRNPTTVGARTTSLAGLSFGRGVSDSLVLGATINLGGSSLNNNAFDMDAGFGAAIWGRYSEGGATRTGLQFRSAFGYMQNEGDVTRGRLLTDVAAATGSATLDTRGVQATLGYGVLHGDWLLSPSLGVAHYETTRDAYTEAGATFNASYDEMRASRTVVTVGVTGEFSVGDNDRLSFGVGVDHEANPERSRLTGTSDIPGLATFDLGSSFNPNRTRMFVTAGYTHEFGNGSTVSGDLRVGQATYGTTNSVGAGLTYAMRF